MAENIASAIVVPEPESPQQVESTDGALKRRASHLAEDEQDGKRQRMSPPGKKSPTAGPTVADVESRDQSQISRTASISEQPSGASRESRRPSSNAVEEKQRSKRLFGALLGNLNRPAAGDKATRRRQEIEERKKAELRRQDERDAQNQHQKQERLAEQRKREQITVDEQNMRIRHRHLLDCANYLQTVSEPRIYYRPWDLRPDEEDRIDNQVNEAQAQVDIELAGFQRHSNIGEGRDGHSNRSSTQPEGVDPTRDDGMHSKELDGALPAQHEEEHTEKSVSTQAATSGEPELASVNTDSAAPPIDSARDMGLDDKTKHVEDDGDHVVEGDEDTVIY